MGGPGAGGGGEGADGVGQAPGGPAEVEAGLLTGDLGSEADPGLGLGPGLDLSGLEGVEGIDGQPAPDLGQPHGQGAGVLPGVDRDLGGQQHRASVHAGVDHEGGDPGHLGPVQQGPLHRRRAPVGGQEREVEVDDAPRQGGQHRVGQQVAEGAGDADVGARLGQPPRQLGVAAPRRLEDRQPGRLGGLLDRRGRPAAPVAGPVGPGDHGHDLVGGRQQRLQRRHRRRRGAQVDDPHARPARRSCRA